MMFEKWAMVYSFDDAENANELLRKMRSACGKLGIYIEDPQWVEVPHSDQEIYITAINTDINPNSTDIALVIIRDPKIKDKIKSALD